MNDDNKGKEKLKDAREKFELLKSNLDNYDVRNLLEDASVLREHIRMDTEITDVCKTEIEQANLRKNLLEDISKLQMDIITKNTRYVDSNVMLLDAVIADFEKAKTALAEMTDKEIEQEMFKEAEEPKLYSGITECQTHISTLNQVAANCKNGKYIVLIMGDFQSGKSTTLDTICDGRHISAIGDGTATSAVLVSVTYAKKESITIRWRNKNQFQTVFSHIKQYLPDFDWKDFDLDNVHYRQKLADAIESLRQSKNCPNVGDGDAKFLMLCDLVLRYYHSLELQAKKSALQSISDISEVTRFPKDGESKWKKSGISTLTIDEAVFIFIDLVECHIPSETLKYLNCTIIDSPGLFNSSYDTMVTETAMVKAHAIMYVLPYHKGMGQDVSKSLYTIKNNYADVHRKLFIVNNLRSTDDNLFFDSNCKQIRCMFGTNKSIKRYDANLSYLAQVKRHYTSGTLTNKDYQHLMRVTKKSFSGIKEIIFCNFEETWNYHIRKYEDVVENVAAAQPEEILKESGFKDMITALKDFITRNEAYSVILSNGINPMVREMEAIRSSLCRLYVEPYLKSHEEMVALWQSRIEKAERFQTTMTEMVKTKLFSGDPGRSLCDRIAADEYLKLFTSDFYQEMINDVCGVLYDNKGKLLCTKTLITDKAKFKKRFTELATPWIEEKIVDLVKHKIIYWCQMMESEQDITVTNIFAPEMKNMEVQLQADWNKLYDRDETFKMQDYLYVPKSLNGVKLGEDGISSTSTVGIKPAGMNPTLLGGLVVEISIAVAGIATLIASYITAVFLDPSGTTFLAALGLGIGTTVVMVVAPNWIRNKFVNGLSKKVGSQIKSDSVTDSFKKMVNGQMKKILTTYDSVLRVNIQKMRNDRDIALNLNPNQEELCYRAVEVIIAVDGQLDKYEEYKKQHV